ncbi:MAG TPA: 2'-5' RNA ligase family protein [Candidatus Saccharimonadales bacterium]|jgi:2'-5' RNA ligase|nr:2'-5' RNA ligase family protein [Candidatus Saccharimonadales bacterium]
MPSNHTHKHLDHPPQSIYFIGIALPPDVDKKIAALKWRLHDEQPHTIMPVIPHVTLLHPPSLQGILPSQLIPRIHDIAERYLPITITLNRVGFFGPRVCYVEAESFSLYSLQSRLMHLLPPEAQATHYKRDFLPHVTLAQTYNPATLSKTKVTDIINDTLNLPITFTVNSVTHFTRIKPRVYSQQAVESERFG